ncbi:MAG: ribosome maturation factor RimM [Methylophilaceae bacterium]|jgi:16S rRNA processing protein RimM|nr:ribosome maturation factor RimM [Methylophilaceae bacterium]NCA26903.1 ribosome maturation factor RimM [Methylophilaceae bacterium]
MIVMGRIVAPYGIYGWVKVQVSTESIDSLYDYPEWWIGREDNSTQPGIKNSPWQKYKVEHLKIHNDVLIAKLKGVDDRDAAFALKSKHVAVPREALPVPDEGEYYWTDLIGLNVTNQQNVPLGVIADVFETGANDVIVVKDPKDGKERLLPFVDQAILEVDLAQKTMLVDWPIEWDE